MGSRNPTMASRSRGAVSTCVEPVSFGEMILGGGGGGGFPARRGVMKGGVKGFFLEVQGPRGVCKREFFLGSAFFASHPLREKKKGGGGFFRYMSPVDHVFGETPRKTVLLNPIAPPPKQSRRPKGSRWSRQAGGSLIF